MFTELKREAYEANLEIPRQGLAIYTFGNVSAFDAARGVFAIKPSGVPYDRLTPDAMIVVDVDGRTVEGRGRPSSDTATHAVLYRAFGDIGGICHSHSMYAVAWAQACREIPILGTTHADHLTAPVPVTRPMSDEAIERNYEIETGRQIVERMRGLDHHEVEMIVVACHGPFTWGGTAHKAVYNSRVLEEIAHMAYLTETINPAAPPLKDTLIRKHYLRKHGVDAYYGQS
ncbi:L-ribulose-5-phosphate 4-epimerase UlaF [Pararobbsia alpina]|uniref:L-ribulose-5-phosphate 4-epimerase AraD n=1 Tax=Pararobbsia alpina TaxID=621374 RepID=UPI0039A772C5